MRTPLKYGLLCSVSVILSACGGGSSSSGGNAVSTTSQVSGTITGFGSLVVDGVEYPELPHTLFRTQRGGLDSDLGADDVMLGQHVELKLDANGNVSQVVVVPDVQGAVTSVTSTVTTGSGASATILPAITVAGVLVTVNTDATQGPVTSFGGGYAALGDIQLNDNLEVHGLLLSANGVNYVQATYIGKQPAFTGTRITGAVGNYDAANNTFTLGTDGHTVTISAAGAVLRPANAALTNGAIVSVWSDAAISGNALTAKVITVRNKEAVAGTTLTVSGAISNYAAASSFIVNGVTVDASGVTLPPNIASLADGMLVAVKGTTNSNGVLVASQIRVLKSKTSTDLPVVMLQGSISNFVSAANFTVRGVVVDAGQNPVFDDGKSATDLAEGAFVAIEGTLSNNTVVATKVHFPPALPRDAVIDARAMVSGYDAATGKLTLNVGLPHREGPVTVTTTLDSTVTYVNGTADALVNGQPVIVHAVFAPETGVLTVRSITFLPQKPPAAQDAVLLMGEISAVTTGDGGAISAFTLRGLTIQMGNATVQGPDGGSVTLAAGSRVAVYAQSGSGNTLTALKVLMAPPPR